MKHSPGSFLYVFAFDDLSFEELTKMNLINTKVISLKEFEDEELLKIKPSRSRREYCWTCSSSIIKYCIEKFNLDVCTYLDADLYFFSDPAVLLEEMKDSSVLITEHRYTPKYDQTNVSGKYCVQFMSFKNNTEGMSVLNWWRDRCLEWCYARYEDGKNGDQMYLDDWMTRFTGVHELQHLGGGVAPWNMQQYEFHKKGDQVELVEISSKKKYPLVFFHFHALRIFKDHFDLGIYELADDAKKLVYLPYLEALGEVDNFLKEKKLNFNWHAMGAKEKDLRSKLRELKRKLLGTYNVVPGKRELHG